MEPGKVANTVRLVLSADTFVFAIPWRVLAGEMAEPDQLGVTEFVLGQELKDVEGWAVELQVPQRGRGQPCQPLDDGVETGRRSLQLGAHDAVESRIAFE